MSQDLKKKEKKNIEMEVAKYEEKLILADSRAIVLYTPIIIFRRFSKDTHF